MTTCFFCTAPVLTDGVRGSQSIKSEVFITADDFTFPPSLTSLQFLFRKDSIISEQLKAIVILRSILKIPDEILCKLLKQDDGEFEPQNWLNICSICEELVLQFYQTQKEICRMERILAGIEAELKLKIEKSRKDGDGFSSAAGGRVQLVRAQILKSDRAFDETDLEEDAPNLASQFIAQQPDSPDEQVTTGEFKVCWENIQSVQYSEGDEDDTEEASVNYVGESRAYADTDGGKEVATRTRKKKLNAKTQFNGRAKTRRYTCEECPYDTTNLLRFETHRTFHEEGSGAVPCEDCGWYLMPKSMGRHRAHAHPTGRPKVVDKIRGAGVSQVRLCYLQCPECQALIARLEDYREHERLHESGAGETCAECGWLCKRMSSHHARWHPNETSFVRHKYPRYIKRMPSRLHHPNQTPPIQKKYAK